MLEPRDISEIGMYIKDGRGGTKKLKAAIDGQPP